MTSVSPQPSDFERRAINKKHLILDIEDEITYIERIDHFEFYLTRKENLFKYIQPSFEQRFESFLMETIDQIRKEYNEDSADKNFPSYKKLQQSNHMKILNDEVNDYYKNRNLINLYSLVFQKWVD